MLFYFPIKGFWEIQPHFTQEPKFFSEFLTEHRWSRLKIGVKSIFDDFVFEYVWFTNNIPIVGFHEPPSII